MYQWLEGEGGKKGREKGKGDNSERKETKGRRRQLVDNERSIGKFDKQSCLAVSAATPASPAALADWPWLPGKETQSVRQSN